MRSVAVLLLLLCMTLGCMTKSHTAQPSAAPAAYSQDAPAHVVKQLEKNWREGSAFGSRRWEIVATSPPLLFSHRDFVDVRTGATLWTWRGPMIRIGPRPTGNAREVAFVLTEENTAFISFPNSVLIIADVALGREVARHALGVASGIWFSERGVAVRSASERPLTFTTWDGRAITILWTGDVDGVEAGDDAVIVRTRVHGRTELRRFDPHTGAPVGDVAVREEPSDVEIETIAEDPQRCRWPPCRAWRLVRGGIFSTYTSRWAAPQIVHVSNDEVLVAAVQCIDRGERDSGRILTFDRDLRMLGSISLPPWEVRFIERTPTTLRLLAGGFQRECPERFDGLSRHRPPVDPALLEVEQP